MRNSYHDLKQRLMIAAFPGLTFDQSRSKPRSYLQELSISSGSGKVSFLDYGSTLMLENGWMPKHRCKHDSMVSFPSLKAFICDNVEIQSSSNLDILFDNETNVIDMSMIACYTSSIYKSGMDRGYYLKDYNNRNVTAHDYGIVL